MLFNGATGIRTPVGSYPEDEGKATALPELQ